MLVVTVPFWCSHAICLSFACIVQLILYFGVTPTKYTWYNTATIRFTSFLYWGNLELHSFITNKNTIFMKLCNVLGYFWGGESFFKFFQFLGTKNHQFALLLHTMQHRKQKAHFIISKTHPWKQSTNNLVLDNTGNET